MNLTSISNIFRNFSWWKGSRSTRFSFKIEIVLKIVNKTPARQKLAPNLQLVKSNKMLIATLVLVNCSGCTRIKLILIFAEELKKKKCFYSKS